MFFKFRKVLGFGKTPPHVGKISQIISFFLFESVPNHDSSLDHHEVTKDHLEHDDLITVIQDLGAPL